MHTALNTLAKQFGAALKTRHWKLVTAESCTGGGLAYWITNIPGSSDWFERGFVTYSNEAKEEQLGVPATLIKKFGAVSEEVARAMAEGALKHSHAQVSIAITGIAGPEGGTAEKPVGTVWLAWAGTTFQTQSKLNQFTGDRKKIREKTIETALSIIFSL